MLFAGVLQVFPASAEPLRFTVFSGGHPVSFIICQTFRHFHRLAAITQHYCFRNTHQPQPSIPDERAMRDAGIISAGNKVEHYEIASYGTLKTFAQILGLTEAAEILNEILEEEKQADATLTQIAESTINIEASEEEAEAAE